MTKLPNKKHLLEDADDIDFESKRSHCHSNGLCESIDGIIWEYISKDESDFLYYEIFVHDIYLKHFKSCVEYSNSPVIVDIGANIGLFSLQCHHRFANCRIIAIEALKPIYDVLQRNVKGISGVHTAHIAIGQTDEDGTTQQFYYLPNVPGESTRNLHECTERHKQLQSYLSSDEFIQSSELDDDEYQALLDCYNEVDLNNYKIEQCKVSSLSKLMSTTDIVSFIGADTAIDILKIDVEGDELAVLKGIDDALFDRIKYCVIEVYDVDNRLEDIKDILIMHRFTIIAVEEQQCHHDHDYISVTPPGMRLHTLYASKT